MVAFWLYIVYIRILILFGTNRKITLTEHCQSPTNFAEMHGVILAKESSTTTIKTTRNCVPPTVSLSTTLFTR